MTQATSPPLPGSMTVPPLAGWEVILAVVALLVAVAVVSLVVLAAGAAENGRSEWQAWLDARSSRHSDPDACDRSAELVRPEPGG
ncbi:hypothetical protein [Blastococcus mobilis]|uniref:Uncharacterized protein n=1 Tax=Blastococcus mobilis TaxID=1938746 RepID=A0A238US79_9ACTN|nr:hypothetical protein [Blastococcus mobilis]SNR24876.1 hypothetical protein SAMN06272737_101299 [Blastococcus mobilis]